MEEDIKILEDETNALGLFFKCKGTEEYKQAIENLLTRNKQLERENVEEFAMGYTKCKLDFKDNYIPKSKIRKKIEELDIEIGEICENIEKSVDEERAYWKKERHDAIMQRFILQEILED